MNSKAVNAILNNANFNSQGSMEATSGALAAIMQTVSSSPNHALTIDISSREDIYNILDVRATRFFALIKTH